MFHRPSWSRLMIWWMILLPISRSIFELGLERAVLEEIIKKKEKRWADRLREMTESIKGGLEFDSQVPLQQQQLLYNGKEMGNSETLSCLGVTNGDLMMMVFSPASSSARPASPEPASGSLLAKRMLVSLSHDQTNGVKDEKEERGK
ncbi:unnamed protein product [Lactuca saligna]|uniref:Ubiquitin-like domain-containing protein n=1 Tax=Lactuca saligna TaxID=75948 RepID=A0AA36ELR4_LACSI|nr:unnamed protein product [Lactuca saligna]